MKVKGINPVPMKWVFKNQEESDGLICLKLINLVQGYMQVPGVDFTYSFTSIASYIQTSILIGLNLYHKEYRWVAGICDVEAAFLHPNTEVEMFIKGPEGILDLGIIAK